jgi:tetratricopeptide (TPR) repeat protein
MELENAIDIALQGNAVMFAGAGYSVGATIKNGDPVLTGNQLSSHFCRKCGISGDYSLPDSAEVYLDKFGELALVNELKALFTATKTTRYHQDLCNIPWRRIYTTNYDNVLELSFSAAKRTVQSLTLKSPVESVQESKPVCLHINGSIAALNGPTIPDEFKLTDSSYANANTFGASPWSEVFRNDIRVSDSVFFLGYSLFDLDIKRILYVSSLINEKVFFITSKQPSEVERVKIKQYGTIVPVGVEMFSSMVKARKASFTPASVTWNPTCFERCQKPAKALRKLRDDDLFKLLIYGQSEPEFIYQALSKTSDTKYYIKRAYLEKIANRIANSTPTDVIIHSDLGNGKSLLVEGLRYLMVDKGISVFTLIDNSDLFCRDFDKITNMSGRRVIIVENYVHWFSAIEHMTRHRSADLFFIFTARTAVHDVNFNHLSKYTNLDDCLEIDLNIMVDSELAQVRDLLNLYGLWGDDADLGPERKAALLVSAHHSQMQSILLNIIKSEDVARRLAGIVTIINENRAYTEVVLAVLILDSLGIRTTIDVVMNLLETDLLNRSSFRKDPQIRELIDMDTFEIHAKSSITARYLLSRVEDQAVLIQTLIKLSRMSSELSYNREIYYAILRELTNFSNIQGILPSTGKLDNCIKFYESIKDLAHSRGNPHFWLQYAIARMAIKDYAKAGRYFDTSYALARKKDNYDTYQIDNHFARYLLEKQMEDGKPETAMESFRKAHKIIRQQSYDGKENRYYPYRVACLYYDFYHTYKSTLSSPEQQEYFRACVELKKNVRILTEKVQGHHFVKEYLKRINSVLPAELNG